MKSQGPALTASQSVHEQPTKGLSGFQEALNVSSHRVEMPRQNSDPTSENPPLPTRIEKFDRSSWLRQEEDIPPKVILLGFLSTSPSLSSLSVIIILRLFWSLLIPKLRIGLSFIISDLRFPQRNGGSGRLNDLEAYILYPELELATPSVPNCYFNYPS